jgi:hypothetical protein
LVGTAFAIRSGATKKLLNPVTRLTASHWRDKNMKPTTKMIENEGSHRESRNLPKIDLHYHSISTGSSGGCCARLTSPSFRSISRAYFDTEANHYFLAEAAVFAAIMLTAAVPLISSAHAVLNLIGA